jgi:hypothetical protein
VVQLAEPVLALIDAPEHSTSDPALNVIVPVMVPPKAPETVAEKV